MDVRNWRTIAVFLGPRQIMAEVRFERRKARDMQWRGPMGWREGSLGEELEGWGALVLALVLVCSFRKAPFELKFADPLVSTSSTACALFPPLLDVLPTPEPLPSLSPTPGDGKVFSGASGRICPR